MRRIKWRLDALDGEFEISEDFPEKILSNFLSKGEKIMQRRRFSFDKFSHFSFFFRFTGQKRKKNQGLYTYNVMWF